MVTIARSYIIIYFVYGLIYFLFGIKALDKNKNRVKHIPIVSGFLFLGIFGISHGISEWFTMLTITNRFDDSYVLIMNIKFLLKSISFIMLMLFGVTILKKRYFIIHKIRHLPILLFIGWFILFITLIALNGFDYHINNRLMNTLIIRYIFGLSGAFIAAIAILVESRYFHKQEHWIKRTYIQFAIILFIYGLVDGLFVRKNTFFPANIIHNQLFKETLGFPIQFVKILIGFIILIFLIRLIKTFTFEHDLFIKSMEKKRIESESRASLGYDLHDSFIQDLYGIQFKVQHLKTKHENIDFLNIDDHLKNVLENARKFISFAAFKQISFKELIERLKHTHCVFDLHQNISFDIIFDQEFEYFNNHVSLGNYQVFLILQEGLINALKHSHASRISLRFDIIKNEIIVSLTDNGKGFDVTQTKDKHFGMNSMLNRAKDLNATLTIDSDTKTGSCMTLRIKKELFLHAKN